MQKGYVLKKPRRCKRCRELLDPGCNEDLYPDCREEGKNDTVRTNRPDARATVGRC